MNFSLLRRNRDFRFLYIGQFVSFMGTMITGVALPYQIYHETHSTIMVGFLSLIQLLPLLVTALLGGVFADRYQRRKLLLVSEILLALGCLILGFNATLTQPSLLIIFAVAFFMSAINGLHRPALDSIVQQIVEKDDYAALSSLATFKYSVCMILGPAVGGLIIAQFGIVNTFLVDFATFGISLIAILLMNNIPKPSSVIHPSIWISLKQGFRYAASRQELIGTYTVDFVAMMFAMPNALMPAIAASFGGVKTLGMLYAAPAVGALFISLFAGWAKQVKQHGKAIIAAASLWGVAIIFFGFAKNLYLALFFLAMAGAFDAISGVFRSIMWNETIPYDLRGRLSGIEMISYLSGPKLGDTEAGLVAGLFGVTASVVSGGILCVLGVFICGYFLPKFWHYHSEEDTSGLSSRA